MRPLFSIIVPTYNRADKLRRAIESVERQTCRDFEIIICDDGSTDGTRAVAGSFSGRIDLKYQVEDNWGGPARPRNNGVRSARGEWICFLDADDWWYPEKLEAVSRFLGTADIVYHDLDVYPRKVWRYPRKVRGRRLRHPVFSDLMLKANAIPNSSAVIRKSVIDQAGGFSEDRALIGMEDYDLWLRVARMTDRFTYVPRSLGAYSLGGDNLSEVSERQISRFTAIYERHMPYLPQNERIQAGLLLQYSIARIKQQMGLYDEARALFRTAVETRHLRWKLMSLAMLSLMRCRAIFPERWIRI